MSIFLHHGDTSTSALRMMPSGDDAPAAARTITTPTVMSQEVLGAFSEEIPVSIL